MTTSTSARPGFFSRHTAFRLVRSALLNWHVARGRLRKGRKRLVRIALLAAYNRRAGTYASSLEHVYTRDQIPELLNRRGLLGTGVEVGVQKGRYSEFILRNWRGERLISVDPWLEAAADEYVDRANVPQAQHELYFRKTQARLACFGPRSEIRRATSLEAAAGVPDASVDFVYLDARHDRESVLEDLELWYPKLRPGAIFAGHDYVDGLFPSGDFRVKSAVDEFFAPRGLPVHATQGGPSAIEAFPSWIVVVPGA